MAWHLSVTSVRWYSIGAAGRLFLRVTAWRLFHCKKAKITDWTCTPPISLMWYVRENWKISMLPSPQGLTSPFFRKWAILLTVQARKSIGMQKRKASPVKRRISYWQLNIITDIAFRRLDSLVSD